jgi:hypothetical protein
VKDAAKGLEDSWRGAARAKDVIDYLLDGSRAG